MEVLWDKSQLELEIVCGFIPDPGVIEETLAIPSIPHLL
jgi:hypothetical protein